MTASRPGGEPQSPREDRSSAANCKRVAIGEQLNTQSTSCTASHGSVLGLLQVVQFAFDLEADVEEFTGGGRRLVIAERENGCSKGSFVALRRFA